jgi:hypothetical protein
MTRLDPRRARDLERALTPLTNLTTFITTNGTTIATNLTAWIPGPASASYDGTRAPIGDDGTNNGTVPRQALRTDPIAHAALELARQLDHAARAAEHAQRIARSLLTIDPELAQALADQAPVDRSASCTNCGTYVANTPADRIRAGRCDACYRYRRRHDGMERPRVLWDTEDFTASGDSGDMPSMVTPQE